MVLDLSLDAILLAVVILVLRVVNNAVGTMRLIMMARQKRGMTALLGTFEAFTFAVTIAFVANDLTNVLNMAAYCLGFAAGGWVGMAMEERFFISYVTVHIITRATEPSVAEALRHEGFGVTEIEAQGREGDVAMLHVVVQQRDIGRVRRVSEATDPAAFISVEEARSVARGWLGRPMLS